MIDGSGNKNFNVTVVPSDPNALYGVSFYGSGVGFPTYGILGTASGGARGTTTFSKYFNDSVLSADGTQSRVYSGCLPVHIFEGSEAGNNFAYFNLNLTVNP